MGLCVCVSCPSWGPAGRQQGWPEGGVPAAGLRLLRPGEGFARQRDGRVSSPCGRGLPSGGLQLPVQPGRWGDAVRGGGRPCCVSRASQACACVSVRVCVCVCPKLALGAGSQTGRILISAQARGWLGSRAGLSGKRLREARGLCSLHQACSALGLPRGRRAASRVGGLGLFQLRVSE